MRKASKQQERVKCKNRGIYVIEKKKFNLRPTNKAWVSLRSEIVSFLTIDSPNDMTGKKVMFNSASVFNFCFLGTPGKLSWKNLLK